MSYCEVTSSQNTISKGSCYLKDGFLGKHAVEEIARDCNVKLFWYVEVIGRCDEHFVFVAEKI